MLVKRDEEIILSVHFLLKEGRQLFSFHVLHYFLLAERGLVLLDLRHQQAFLFVVDLHHLSGVFFGEILLAFLMHLYFNRLLDILNVSILLPLLRLIMLLLRFFVLDVD